MFCRSILAEIDVNVFPENYHAAQQAWLAAQANLPYLTQPRSFPCPEEGPQQEMLQTDTVWLGQHDAAKVLVLIAGTHGIEGFAGSAVQLDLLALLVNKKLRLPQDTALLLIHALTPWGYAWLRRCDADGVDLNRNAVDFSLPLPNNPGYSQLRHVFFLTDPVARQTELHNYTQQYGRVALEQAISGGQYQDSAAPFYGGNKPAHGRLVCEALIRDYALSDRQLAVIDIHTGLGPYSYGELICDHQPNSSGATIAKQWYGDAVTLPFAGTSSSVPKLGLMDYLWHAVMDECSCFITLEFGTYSTDQLFETLCQDHLLWSQSATTSERSTHSQLMKQHFCPTDSAWQLMVLFRARQVILQALQGLNQRH